jgi:hypothetical protein
MIPRHANELLSHLENVVDVGCTVIRRNVLLHWYGQERLTVTIWRDLEEKWSEVLEQSSWPDKSVPLLAAEGEGVVTFVWGAGLTPDDNAWLKKVSERSRSSVALEREKSRKNKQA